MFLQLVDDIRAAFAARGFTDIEIVDGLTATVEQQNYGAGSANRVAFIPSEGPMTVGAPRFIGDIDNDDGKVRRQLHDVGFVFEVTISAYDADNPDRYLAHCHRCFDIWEAVAQEVQAAYAGEFEWSNVSHPHARKDGVHGAELAAELTLHIPLFDKPYALASPAPKPGEPKPVT
jgi:hypothetical protein